MKNLCIMKKFIFLLFLLSFFTYLFAQDIIITKTDEHIEAKIVTVYDKEIIDTITYENGEIEKFENAKINIAESNVITNNEVNVKTNTEKTYKNIMRFKPLSMIISAIALRAFELRVHYARYLSRKVAIPVEVELAFVPGVGTGFALMTGIEAVPATHRQKSGLYLNGLIGFIAIESTISVVANPNIGYQLVTKKGFVFNTNLGPRYNGATKTWGPAWAIDFGFAF